MSVALRPAWLDRRAAPALIVATVSLAAWLSLTLWASSPYARYVEHAGWADAGALAALCRAVPGGEVAVPAVLHALAWVLMIAAMMLPTALPLVAMFQRLTDGRPDAHALVTNLAMWYSPDQVEFYLVDFKKGVEFKTYATHALPRSTAAQEPPAKATAGAAAAGTDTNRSSNGKARETTMAER